MKRECGFLKWNDSLYEPYAKENITDWIKEQLKKESERMEYRTTWGGQVYTYYSTNPTNNSYPFKNTPKKVKKPEDDYDAENEQLDNFLSSFSRKADVNE